MNHKPQVLYVHIPKAAGSALNAFFIEQYGAQRCLPHAENRLSRPDRNIGEVEEYLYVSAHMAYPVLRGMLDLQSRFVMTVMREPIEQLISHIAWVRYQADPAQKHAYKALPPHVQGLVDRLSANDIANPVILEQLLEDMEHPELSFFDNCQTRYLHPPVRGPMGPGTVAHAKRNLRALDFVGVHDRMADVFAYLSFTLGLPPGSAGRRVNESKRKYGLDASDPAIREVLRPYVALDQELYETAQSLFAASMYRMLDQAQSLDPRVINRDVLARLIEHRANQTTGRW